MRLVATGVVAVLMLSGCGSGSSGASVKASEPTEQPSTVASLAGKHVEQGSGKLAMSIEPTSGPVGTVVQIHATDCGDADGRNHAVSFNPDMANLRPDAPVDDVPAYLVAGNLTATYTISRSDARGSGHGRFFVQCATDLVDLPFTISR